MSDTAEDGKRVLAYFRDMMDFCQQFHRQDLVDEYSDAWEFAASKIFGPLPPRKTTQGFYVQEPKPTTPPGWKVELYSRPYRRIAARFSRIFKGREIRYERLECGHEVMAPVGYSIPAKRRRCRACGREVLEAKKQPASVAAAPRKKAVGA
jgi:hypothetical protein